MKQILRIAGPAVFVVSVVAVAALAAAGTTGLRQLASANSWEAAFERQLVARGIGEALLIEPVAYNWSSGQVFGDRQGWSLPAECDVETSSRRSGVFAALCERLSDGQLQL